jgi:hypothetical protein
VLGCTDDDENAELRRLGGGEPGLPSGSASSMDDLAERLEAIAEQLSDLALDRLRTAWSGAEHGGDPDPSLVGEERRLTRARRAVEKAAALLRSDGGSTSSQD